MFKPRTARRSLARHRKKGLDAVERRMVTSIVGSGCDGATVLEIGGGIGGIQAELLDAGATEGKIVELVATYEPYAQELARERGLEDRTTFVVVDILENPESVEPADLVVLNRVVCCSPDGVELTAAAARMTRRRLAVSYPRDVWWLRAGVRAMNAGLRIMRRSFRVFVHQPAAIVSAAESVGLRPTESGREGAWEFTIFAAAR